jgi:ABC-type transport system involved in cytochrome c biogenesis permease subunit
MKLFRCLSIALLLIALPAAAAEKGELDWDTWERLPMLEGGRRLPLDTFARSKVAAICGREQPKLWLPASERAPAELRQAAEALFPDGKPRRFRASELIFSWLVEPERWQAVPILVADHKQLREDVLKLQRADDVGRLRFLSPWAAQNNFDLHRRLESLALKRQEAGQGWQAVGVDYALERLEEAYLRFAEFTTDPRDGGHMSTRFRARRDAAMAALEQLAETLRRENRMTADDAASQRLVAAGERLEPLYERAGPDGFSWEKTERHVAALTEALEALRQHCVGNESPRLALLATDAARQIHEAHLALYDTQITLRVVPALNPSALEPDREPSDDAQPWLGMRAMLHGSEELLRGYPAEPLARVRGAWARVADVYRDRANADRRARFAAAMDEFSDAVRALGEAVTPLRDDLPLHRKDTALLLETAYPPAGYTSTEVFYNRFSPFFWSWIVGLASLLCFSLSFGLLRRPMFWLGLTVLVAAQAITVWGFGLRMAITGLVPLTNMFETVVFVGLCVPVLGAWFALLPIFWPGLRGAWRATSARLLIARADGGDEQSLYMGSAWRAANILALLMRLALTAPVAWITVSYISLAFSPSGGLFQVLGDGMVWLVALSVVLCIVYYVPRVTAAFVLALITVPQSLQHLGWAGPVAEAIDRRAFLLVGAAVGVLAAIVAYFAPDTVMTEELSTTQPVLRDNFWLFVHVLSITASYGAGALAWGLSNIAMAFYTFGRYRPADEATAADAPLEQLAADEPDEQDAPDEPDAQPAAPVANPPRLPPEQCGTLAQYSYKALQVAVLLLAAGTILGALWADKAWGHFWSWDSKEVWSLLTLLAYMGILHARHVNWVGHFGLAFGAVLGATFIIVAWYGVNFLLPAGKHSYGGGAGGQWQVGIAVGLNWLFVLAATIRYNLETKR